MSPGAAQFLLGFTTTVLKRKMLFFFFCCFSFFKYFIIHFHSKPIGKTVAPVRPGEFSYVVGSDLLGPGRVASRGWASEPLQEPLPLLLVFLAVEVKLLLRAATPKRRGSE